MFQNASANLVREYPNYRDIIKDRKDLNEKTQSFVTFRESIASIDSRIEVFEASYDEQF